MLYHQALQVVAQRALLESHSWPRIPPPGSPNSHPRIYKFSATNDELCAKSLIVRLGHVLGHVACRRCSKINFPFPVKSLNVHVLQV
jgi:hypothetical protein